MGRPRKKARDLTTEEAVKRLFPQKGLIRAKEEVKKADEQATKRESR
jgi:hypothetical protein